MILLCGASYIFAQSEFNDVAIIIANSFIERF